MMTENEIRKAYYRAWRAANKDRIREYNRRYWEKRAKKINAALPSLTATSVRS